MPTYYKGRVEPRNLSHLIALSHARHGHRLRLMKSVMAPPATWDSVARGWVGPVKDQASCGSCHSEDTEVLTQDGWVKWPEYDWSTPLATMNCNSGSLEYQPCLQQHIYKHDGPIYYANHPSLDFALTGNHRMYVYPRKARHRPGYKVLQRTTVEGLPKFCELPASTTGWLGIELEKVGVGDKWHFSGDDFISLVALVISDGNVFRNSDKNVVSFCCFRDDRMDMVKSLAARLSIKEQESRPGVWNIYDKELVTWFLQNCFEDGEHTAPYKFVPSVVKCASQRQIALFLNYFGDQSIYNGTIRRFYTSSRKMAGDIQEILLKIGKRSSITESPARTHKRIISNGKAFIGKHPEFIINENSRGVVLGKEDLVKEYYKGNVYCATVPNGTLITKRNGKLLISSNCWDFSGTGTCEVAFNVAGIGGGPNKMVLSEEYTLSCAKNGGCNGDDNTTVLDWAKSTGLPLSADYGSYTASAGRCTWKSGMALFKIDDWGFADSNGGQGVTPAADIKAAIMQYGAVGCAVAADDAFSNYQSGTVFDRTTSQSIDHDVMLVGWDDTKSTVSGKTVWKMRNSWGPGWGTAGYMWILEGVNLIGTESVWAVVHNPNPPLPPFVKPTP